jgi:hypothetical protein
MTEAEWLTCPDPLRMLEYLEGRISPRKLRLFACGCCRRLWRVWRFPDDEFARVVIERAERYADGQASDLERMAAAMQELTAQLSRPSEGVRSLARIAALNAARAPDFQRAGETASYAQNAIAAWVAPQHLAGPPEEFPAAALLRRRDWEGWGQATLMRDLIGNPFRPVAADPRWQTATVVLAQAIYDDRAFDRLPVLADALQEAGCLAEDILDHCRDQGPHVGGCWVVDLLLGKE